MVAHQYLMQETDTQGKLDDCMHMACGGHMHAGVRRSACGIMYLYGAHATSRPMLLRPAER